jgi:hypothetical protein
MTWDDIRTIQRELNLTLPSGYVDTICSYPFPSDLWLEMVLINDARLVVSKNQAWRITSVGNEAWNTDHFVIGDDGGESCYYINTRLEDSPVFTISLEDSSFELIEESPSLNEFVLKNLRDYEISVEKERQRMLHRTNKRWWQFW